MKLKIPLSSVLAILHLTVTRGVLKRDTVRDWAEDAWYLTVTRGVLKHEKRIVTKEGSPFNRNTRCIETRTLRVI